MITNKKIMVCGLGSMGKRRLKILQTLYPDFDLMGVDLRADRCLEVKNNFCIQVGNDFEFSFENFKPDAVFVCSPPLTHSKTILTALNNGCDTFSEINLSSQDYGQIIETAQKKDRIAFLSSTFLFRKEIQWIMDTIKNHQRISYRHHVGQNLKDWHPWENYTDFFVAKKESSALREIMAIEFPWLIKAFGTVTDFKVMKNKTSNLKIDYEDVFQILCQHENGSVGSITIDCVSVRGIRRFDAFSDQICLEWSGTPDSLKKFNDSVGKMEPVDLYTDIERNENYHSFVIENPYINEVEDFIGLMEHRENIYPKYSYQEDTYVLELIDQIHG